MVTGAGVFTSRSLRDLLPSLADLSHLQPANALSYSNDNEQLGEHHPAYRAGLPGRAENA
jgi:hypothetical protein